MHLKESNHFDIVVYKITNDCNNNCEYCYEHNKINLHEICNDPIEIIKTIDKTNEKKYNLIFHGGEPLLKLDIISNIVNNTNNVENYGIQTNGILLNKTNINKLKNIYDDFNIGISIDSLSNDARGLSYQNINIFNNIIDAKEKFKNLGILITLNKTNLSSIFKLLNELIKYNIKNIKINNVFTNNVKLMPTKYEIERFWRYYISHYFDQFEEENCNIILNKIRNLGFLNSSCNSVYCGIGKQIISVNGNGQLSPCGRWMNEIKFENYTRSIRQECMLCKYTIFCGNGCIAWNNNSNFFVNECTMNKIIIEFLENNK